MKAKRRIHKFNFDQEKMGSGKLTHVALVDSAANLTQALVMKSKTVSTTHREEEWTEDGYTESCDTVRVHDEGREKVRVVTESSQYSSFYVKVR